MPKTLNIAVIGAGTMAQAVHLPVLRRRWDRFAVTALVDHSPRRRRESAEVWGLEEDKRFETVADLIAAVRAKTVTLDAAVPSTDGLHAEDLLQLMRRGIPVLVEPPLGFSAEEIAKVADFERMTGRRLLMMAYPQQYDDSVSRMAEQIPTKDLRMVDHEVLMPASQPLFGGAHVTTSSYDLPSEVRTQRRSDLQEAVVAGAGDGATQRDRDLYVKGLLTGVAHQLAVLEAAYGPMTDLVAVRHWPKGVIPGSIELLGSLSGGAQVRLVWHYLPFAPEYSEHIQVLSARRRMRVELPAPSHGDRRSTVALREKKSGVVQEMETTATKGSAELMWEAFHAFVEKGAAPLSGAEEARTQVTLLREVLATIVAADDRSIDKDPEEPAADAATTPAADGADEAAAGSESAPSAAETEQASGATETEQESVAVEAEQAPDAAEPEQGAVAVEAEQASDVTQPGQMPAAAEPAAPTLEQVEASAPADAGEQHVPAGAATTERLPSPEEVAALEETRGAASGDPGTAPSSGEPRDVWNLESPKESTWPPAARTTDPGSIDSEASAHGSARTDTTERPDAAADSDGTTDPDGTTNPDPSAAGADADAAADEARREDSTTDSDGTTGDPAAMAYEDGSAERDGAPRAEGPAGPDGAADTGRPGEAPEGPVR